MLYELHVVGAKLDVRIRGDDKNIKIWRDWKLLVQILHVVNWLIQNLTFRKKFKSKLDTLLNFSF